LALTWNSDHEQEVLGANDRRLRPLERSGAIHQRDIHDVHKEVQDIARELRKWTYGIPTLPPGKPVEALFDQLPARLGQGLPDDYDVTISYEDPLGHA
jgi:hypothetical protein